MSEQQKQEEKPIRQIIMESEEDRLKRHIYRTDKEKLQAFTLMLRRGLMFKRAKITHK